MQCLNDLCIDRKGHVIRVGNRPLKLKHSGRQTPPLVRVNKRTLMGWVQHKRVVTGDENVKVREEAGCPWGTHQERCLPPVSTTQEV